MRRIAIFGLAAAVALLSGCSGSNPRTKPVAAAACPPAAAVARALPHTRTAAVRVPGRPYAVVTSSGGRWSFVSLPGAIAVISNRRFAPRLAHVVRLPADAAQGLHGLALSADGQYLFVGVGGDALVIDVLSAERGRTAVVARLTSPARGDQGAGGPSAVIGSPDGRYVFVARARAGGVAVFDLAVAFASGLHGAGPVGVIPVGIGPVALAMSPSGHRLYVASVAPPAASGKPGPHGPGGSLSVIDTTTAELNPHRSVLQTLPAGCEPVSLATSPNGRLLWVTTIADHAVLAFAASRLVHRPRRALVAVVRVGVSPTGLLSFANGRRLLVADSGAGATAGPGPRLTVIDTARALSGRPALIGSIVAGSEPRQLALSPRGATALVADYGSAEVEAIDLGSIR